MTNNHLTRRKNNNDTFKKKTFYSLKIHIPVKVCNFSSNIFSKYFWKWFWDTEDISEKYITVSILCHPTAWAKLLHSVLSGLSYTYMFLILKRSLHANDSRAGHEYLAVRIFARWVYVGGENTHMYTHVLHTVYAINRSTPWPWLKALNIHCWLLPKLWSLKKWYSGQPEMTVDHSLVDVQMVGFKGYAIVTASVCITAAQSTLNLNVAYIPNKKFYFAESISRVFFCLNKLCPSGNCEKLIAQTGHLVVLGTWVSDFSTPVMSNVHEKTFP